MMNRGVDRQAIFFSDRDRVEFEVLLTGACERHAMEVHAICLMGNHYHLVVHCPQGGLSASMHQLGSAYTRFFNDRIGRDGPLFRSRFHSVSIGDDAQLLQTVRYVHRNPLDLGPATDIETYKWSSHRSYLGRRRPPQYLTTNVVLAHFDHDTERYAAFVADEPGDPAGTDSAVCHPIERALDAVRWLPERALVGRRDLERTLRLLLCADLFRLGAGEIARELGFASASSARTALSRARRLETDDPDFARVARIARRIAAPGAPGATSGAWHQA